MTARRLPLALVALPFLVAGCRCDPGTQRIKPVVGVTPLQLTFGQVKVGEAAELPVKVEAKVNAPVTISGISVEDGTPAGSAAAFEVLAPLERVPELSEGTFRVRFSPTARQAYGATLVIRTDDEDRPEVRLALSGEGAHPILAVIPECKATKNCKGTATETPPAIDFGAEPFHREVKLPATELPTVTLVNEGEVTLALTHLSLAGPDAAAFTFEQAVTLPDTLPNGEPALLLGAREGRNLAIRFKPSSEAQDAYAAEMVIRSDDPDRPEVRVALTGTLAENLPPRICANITRVKPADELELRYDTKAHWDPLLVPPAAGYDFGADRDVRPRALVTFSAISDASNTRACTTDPEDQRAKLTYQWTLEERPPGSGTAGLSAAQTATATFTPIATGEYVVRLTVGDQQGHQTTTTLRFVAALKEDLVVQASWNGRQNAYANVDLDLHLVRPGSPLFSFFEEGANQQTSGDVNGFSAAYQKANQAQGVNFDWGSAGTSDDPRLNVDDTGGGPLLENVSLNFPENDPACATDDCAYSIYVHYFADKRQHGAALPCVVAAGCEDGDACGCTEPGARCVANEAPPGLAATGAGRCLVAPEPVVRIFLKANPIAAAEIPLAGLVPPDELAVGAPCLALHVADVLWPAKDGSGREEPEVEVIGADATGRITSPVFVRYGIRATNGLQCSPNAQRGASGVPNWYDEEPR